MNLDADPAAIYALGLVLAWLAGVRAYLTILGVGIAASLGWMPVPESMQAVTSPWVLSVCAALALLEFMTDKMPGVDSVSDFIQTIVRIPAGAFVGGLALGNADEASFAGMLIGGGVAALSHGLKSSARVVLNTSPEPVSNVTTSLVEDGVVIGGLGLAAAYPWLAAGLVVSASLGFALVIWLGYTVIRRLTRSALVRA